jgi:hypothetical protein
MVIARLRTHYSIVHMWGAAYLTRCAGKLEAGYVGGFTESLFYRHRTYVTAAIAGAVAALEAAANELFCDAADGHTIEIGALGEDTIALYAEMWRRGVPRTARYSVTDKFDVALALAKRSPLDPGAAPYQEVSTLAAVRNALIHYEPAWMTAGVSETPEGEKHRLEKRLVGRFALNPVTGPGNPFFPDKCLGHGCASWGVRNAILFADLAFDRLGLKPRYEHLRNELHTTGEP